MRCAKCGSENPDSKRFCGDCGATLTTATGASGSAGRSTPSAAILPVAVEELPQGERKTVSALFADIKGSTELMRDLDPEEAQAIVDPALKIMVEAVRRYEGYVVQSTGDGIFALFGAPVAHEDHPQRALYAALQMQLELRRLSARAAQGRAALEARIGVNTGEVVVRTIETGGKLEYTPIGHTANLASRLQSVAPAGSIAIGDETQRLVEGYFELRALGPTEVKGVGDAINVYEVIGPGPLRTHFQLAARRGLTRFVGRERELAAMQHALGLARGGHGQAIAVMAEAGTGKSRLFYEFKATLPSECKLLEAYSVSHGKASAWLPVLELLRGYFGIEDADDAMTRREKVRATAWRPGPGAGGDAALPVRLAGHRRGRRPAGADGPADPAPTHFGSAQTDHRARESGATHGGDLRGPALDRRADASAARPAGREHRRRARTAAGQLSARVPAPMERQGPLHADRA